MVNFGWSYPPGCSGTPYDEPLFCDICGLDEYSCICPECEVCGEAGEPDCYDGVDEDGKPHMVRTAEQIASLAKVEKQFEEDCAAESEYWENYRKRQKEEALTEEEEW